MNPRIDSQPENHFVSTVSDLRIAIDQIKATQRTGARSVQIFVNQSGSSYNFSTTLAPSTTSTVTITFTANKQKYAIADLTYRVYANTLSNEIHPDLTSSSLWPNPKVIQNPPTTASPLITTWSMKLYGVGVSGSNTFYIKLFVQSTDNGIISP